MPAVAVEYDPQFQSITCDACGIAFAIPYSFYRRYKEHGAYVRCPNPKCDWPSFHITESVKDQYEKKLAQEREKARKAAEARAWAEQQLATTQTKLSRLQKRVGNGVCPCCSRSFTNLKRHMTTKHPEFLPKSKP